MMQPDLLQAEEMHPDIFTITLQKNTFWTLLSGMRNVRKTTMGISDFSMFFLTY